MTDDLEFRRRRATWRAEHRGTKELDLLIGGYASHHLNAMNEAELSHFEAFLELADPELQHWLLAPEASPAAAFCEIVRRLRQHNGLA